MKRSALRDVLGSLLRRGRHRPDALAPAQDEPPQAEPPPQPIVSSGEVVHDYEVSAGYPGAVQRAVTVIAIQAGRPRREVVLNAFEVKDLAVTTIYLPIDLTHGRLFINQTYEGVLPYWRPRAEIADGRYRFQADQPQVISRRTVIIGGPIDGNYYHWMLNWLARVAILKMLRPDVLADPEVALFMDWRAKASPFIDFLYAIGIGDERLIWVDHTNDYLVKDAVLVSFGSQHAIAPAVVEALREMFGPLAEQAADAERPRRLWISRQQLGPNRRRIDNIEAVRPLLDAYGLEEVTLEGRSIAEQIALFRDADFIASVHGAGLTNIIFCSPRCQVLALDTDVHIRFGAAVIYEALAEACGLAYRSLRNRRAPRPAEVERNVPNMHNQDLIVDVAKLDALLREMLGPPLHSPDPLAERERPAS